MENLLLRANDEIVDKHGTSWAAFIQENQTQLILYLHLLIYIFHTICLFCLYVITRNN